MSNKRRPRKELSPSQSKMADFFGPLDGQKIPGGCDHCDAYQTAEPVSAGLWSVKVYHDDDCPWLAERGQ